MLSVVAFLRTICCVGDTESAQLAASAISADMQPSTSARRRTIAVEHAEAYFDQGVGMRVFPEGDGYWSERSSGETPLRQNHCARGK